MRGRKEGYWNVDHEKNQQEGNPVYIPGKVPGQKERGENDRFRYSEQQERPCPKGGGANVAGKVPGKSRQGGSPKG